MEKVILFGASGHAGQAIAKELARKGYDFTAVVRSHEKAKFLQAYPSKYVIANPCNSESLATIFHEQEVVISAFGKSVSPNDKSKHTFVNVDLQGNLNILKAAQKNGIKKFVYLSALHSEKYLHLDYFKVHHQFSEELKKTGIDFSIIKPTGIFSAFIDIAEMAKKGQLFTIGNGKNKTNPIFEDDLASICVDSIEKKNCIVEAGGKTVYSRHELNSVIQQLVRPSKKVKHIPLVLVKSLLPLIRLTNKNLYDKIAFFTEVSQHDAIASSIGKKTIEEYLKERI